MYRLKLLIDFNIGRYTANDAKNQGYDVLFIGDLDKRMLDEDILTLAVRERRLIITMDADFGELVYQSRQDHAGIMLLRIPGADRLEKARVVRHILEQYGDQLVDRFTVYKNGRLRIRARK